MDLCTSETPSNTISLTPTHPLSFLPKLIQMGFLVMLQAYGNVGLSGPHFGSVKITVINNKINCWIDYHDIYTFPVPRA